MTLASVQSEVKKFWRDKKETEDLMYNGSNKPGSGQDSEKKKERRRRRKGGKLNKKQNELVASVTSEDKSKEPYCFKCGEPDHTQNKCPKKESELKCKAHPNSTSHADLACFYHRRAQGLHVLTRPCPDRSKDST